MNICLLMCVCPNACVLQLEKSVKWKYSITMGTEKLPEVRIILCKMLFLANV